MIEDLYIDYNIETAPEGHKHFREGWINIACPHCTGDPGYHLGFNTDGNYYYCWRCDSQFINKTLTLLLKISYRQANDLIREYGIKGGRVKSNSNKVIRITRKAFKLPTGVVKLNKAHKKYLTNKRNFDPVQLVKDWDIQGTLPTSILKTGKKTISYAYRILVPIYWKGEMVSFQCRDYTDKQELKYMACPQIREIINHKHILYGNPGGMGGIGICVEGVFDVWRLGYKAFATFGIGYAPKQVDAIAELFTKVFIVFDPEPQAREKAERLQEELEFRGIKAHNYEDLDCDPADLRNRR